jgi:hypothetical protein
MSIVDQTPELSSASRERVDSYLGEFFDTISSPAKVGEMLKTCLR